MKRSYSILVSTFLSLFFVSYINAILPIETGTPTWTASQKIAQNFPYPLFQSDVVAELITISSSGHYLIREDIDGAILIDADNVILDLDGKKISAASTSIANVIEVKKGRENIKIHNGTIEHDGTSSTRGVSVSADSESQSSCVDLENLTFINTFRGINLDGDSGFEVEKCSIINCICTNCTYAAYISSCDFCLISNIRAYNSTYLLNMTSSNYNIIEDCYFGPSSAGAEPVFITLGEGNIIQRCVVEGLSATGTYFAHAMRFSSVTKTKILDCCVNGVTSESDDALKAVGITLYGTFIECLLQGNTCMNCKQYGFYNNAITHDIVAIENVAINCGTAGYSANIPNVETYDPASPAALENKYNNLDVPPV